MPLAAPAAPAAKPLLLPPEWLGRVSWNLPLRAQAVADLFLKRNGRGDLGKEEDLKGCVSRFKQCLIFSMPSPCVISLTSLRRPTGRRSPNQRRNQKPRKKRHDGDAERRGGCS